MQHLPRLWPRWMICRSKTQILQIKKSRTHTDSGIFILSYIRGLLCRCGLCASTDNIVQLYLELKCGVGADRTAACYAITQL